MSINSSDAWKLLMCSDLVGNFHISISGQFISSIIDIVSMIINYPGHIVITSTTVNLILKIYLHSQFAINNKN